MLRRLIGRLRGRRPGAARAAAAAPDVARLLAPAVPLNLRVDARAASQPRLNVLIPGLAMHCMSGGPNTALNLAYRMALQGVPVRYVATDVPPDRDLGPLWDHVLALAGATQRLPHVEIVNAVDRSRSLPIGVDDVFLATAWWTAQMVKSALPSMRHQRFLYLIQDFEPGLHAFSTRYAMALETYGLDYFAIVNHRLLYDFMVDNAIGRFGDPAFLVRTAVLEPAIDRRIFFPAPRPEGRSRTLLFYARPRSAERNLFELGVFALQTAVGRGAFANADWTFFGIGEQFDPIDLGGGHHLRPLPWMGYEAYAARMRSADMLLSLMLSPHPSYPPLEMAATGGVSITNSFGSKTAARLAEISPNIVAAEPTVDALARALAEGAARCRSALTTPGDATLTAPASWDEALNAVLPFAMRAWRSCAYA